MQQKERDSGNVLRIDGLNTEKMKMKNKVGISAFPALLNGWGMMSLFKSHSEDE